MLQRLAARLDRIRPPVIPAVPFLFSLILVAMVFTLWLGRRRGWWAVLLAFSLSLASSCTASQAFIVTGESVDSLGESFERADDLMKRGLREGKVSNADFRAWTDFSTAFDVSYGEAHEAWRTAQRVKNAVDEKRWAAVLADLGAQVARWYAKLKEANLLPAGAP